MKSRIQFLRLLILCYVFCPFLFEKPLDINAEENLEIIPETVLKEGNFLIGLEQYIGRSNTNSLTVQNITFKTNDDPVILRSSNGIQHKSKEIKIIWKKVPIKNPYIVKRFVAGPFASFESAQKKSENLKKQGYKSVVANPNDWEVWLPAGTRLSNKKNLKLYTKVFKHEVTPFLVNEYFQRKLDGPISLSSIENIKINDTNYGKNFYLVKDAYGTWTLIQKIKFDKYLNGVLPHEIGINSPIEALKAQAVIARTWAIYNSDRFNIDKYHLCISTQCQVYKPPKGQYKNVQKAIKETSDLVITYQNTPINSFYHASNGGISAGSSEAWKIQNYSYFKPMIDGLLAIRNSFTLPIKDRFELTKFLENANEKIYGNNHRLFRWEKKISSSEIQDLLLKNNLFNKRDQSIDIKIVERGFSGRVTKLEIKQNFLNKKVILVKDDIRSILRFLPSNLFIIDKLNDNFWVFKGGGFGHGVGLSQSGAIEMAELGFTYEQILKHYFHGTKIKKFETLSQ